MTSLSSYQNFLLRRTSQDESYLGHSLALYAALKNVDHKSVQDELKCDDEGYVKLALCRNIRFGEPDFQVQITLIASHTGVDTAALANIMKRISFHESMYVSKGGLSSQQNVYLAAAREKDFEQNGNSTKDES